MRNFYLKNILIFLTLTASLFLFKGNTQMGSEGYLSPETVIADHAGKFVYVAMKEARSVMVIDAQTDKIIKKIDVIRIL